MGTTSDDAPEHDHIVPLARGGEHTYENSQTLCRVCNILKGDRDWFEFLAEYGASGTQARADLWWKRAAATVRRGDPTRRGLDSGIVDAVYKLNAQYRGASHATGLPAETGAALFLS
jgi:hypothetical protein